MRKVVVSEFVTLDGVVEAPNKWSFQFWNDASGRSDEREYFQLELIDEAESDVHISEHVFRMMSV
jgi:hypothetical protein